MNTTSSNNEETGNSPSPLRIKNKSRFVLVLLMILFGLYMMGYLDFKAKPDYEFTIPVSALNVQTERELTAALADLKINDDIMSQVLQPYGLTLQEFQQQVRVEFATWVNYSDLRGLTVKFFAQTPKANIREAYQLFVINVVESISGKKAELPELE